MSTAYGRVCFSSVMIGGMSSMYRLRCVGERMDPCGTPFL